MIQDLNPEPFTLNTRIMPLNHRIFSPFWRKVGLTELKLDNTIFTGRHKRRCGQDYKLSRKKQLQLKFHDLTTLAIRPTSGNCNNILLLKDPVSIITK